MLSYFRSSTLQKFSIRIKLLLFTVLFCVVDLTYVFNYFSWSPFILLAETGPLVQLDSRSGSHPQKKQ